MESADMINFVDWNERRHRVEAQKLIQEITNDAR